MTARNDAGFTLAETLIALAVVSMALASIIAATTLVTRHYHQIVFADKTNQRRDAVVKQLQTALGPYQPYDVDGLSGDGRQIDYDCGEKRCHFALTDNSLHLGYVSRGERLTAWPPKNVTQNEPQRLEALILQDRSGTTLGLVRLETDQPEDCQFDMISRACRGEGRVTTP